jgi:uncharacterized protein
MPEERRNTNEERNRRSAEQKGSMTVQEAGRRGGERTSQTHGREFYEAIGHKGGQRVRELIEQGKRAMASEESTSRGATSGERGSGMEASSSERGSSR